MSNSRIDNFKSIKDVAELIGCSTRTVKRRIADGTYIGYKINGRGMWFVDLESVYRAMSPMNVGVLPVRNRKALGVMA